MAKNKFGIKCSKLLVIYYVSVVISFQVVGLEGTYGFLLMTFVSSFIVF